MRYAKTEFAALYVGAAGPVSGALNLGLEPLTSLARHTTSLFPEIADLLSLLVALLSLPLRFFLLTLLLVYTLLALLAQDGALDLWPSSLNLLAWCNVRCLVEVTLSGHSR